MRGMALTTSEIAEDFGTDSKTLRKFLRSHLPKDAQPGQGGRYSFEKKDLPTLKKAWVKWSENKVDKDEPAEASTKTKKAKGKKASKPAEVIEVEDDDEPSAEDLAELDDEDVADIDDLLDDAE
jgi:hypothetical protein